jgi:DNA-binding NtrC family response regulator
MFTPKVLLIEDDTELAGVLATRLQYSPDRFDVTTVTSGGAGIAHMAEQAVDCVVLDYRLPDTDGLTCLGRITESHPGTPVIMITGVGSEEVAVRALKAGVADYIPKQSRNLRSIAAAVADAIRSHGNGPGRSGDTATAPPPIVGSSRVMKELLGLMHQAARSEAPVLLEGETGTGKELLAANVHALSRRAKGPFVTFNCSAVPESLFERELFGYVPGAFPDAKRGYRGRCEQADGGTLLLDEVGDLTPACQMLLLRVIEDRRVRPLGAADDVPLDVRIVATTNGSLEEAVRAGTFRADLYYRLRVIPIRVPPLRERPEDVPSLATHFLRAYSREEGRDVPGFTEAALERFTGRAWPGNVRELQNEVRRAILVAQDGRPIDVDAIPGAGEAASDVLVPFEDGGDRPLREIVRDVERAAILSRLERYDYHRSATARSLGMARESLWAKLRALGLSLPRGNKSSTIKPS